MPRRVKQDEKNINAPEKGAPTETDQASLVKSVGSSLMSSAPDWLQSELDANPDLRKAGFENIDGADIILPRLAVAQLTSPQVLDKELGIELGDIFDTLANNVIAKAGKSTPVILLVANKSRIMFEKPQPPSPILCRSLDGRTATMDGGMDQKEEKTRDCEVCIYSKFSDDSKKPACTEFLSFLVMLPEFNFIVYAVSFKSTGLKAARRWLTQSKLTGAPMFAGKYILSSKKETNGSNTWFNFDYQPAGWVSKEEYARAKEIYQSFEGKTWAPSDLQSEGGEEDTNFPPKETAGQAAAEGNKF